MVSSNTGCVGVLRDRQMPLNSASKNDDAIHGVVASTCWHGIAA